ECTGFTIIDTDTDHSEEETADDFYDLDECGEYGDMVEEHGEAFVLRHADWSGHNNMDDYHGCWGSAEEFAQNFYDDVYGCDNSMYSYIDWEHYARDVLMDYSTYEGDDGLHIFSDH
ncbi:MAG: antirestriction protein ArdA, partial [Planctomycetota bacterium]